MNKNVNIDLVTLGDELLMGIRSNGHLHWIGEQLNRYGARIRRNLVAQDDMLEINLALQHCWQDTDILITTGGLGPTTDDNTREAVAEALGLTMVFDKSVEDAICERFIRLNRHMSDLNRKQCYRPQEASILPNQHGTAPGIFLEHEGKILIMLPGPSNELQPMFTEQVLPLLKEKGLIAESEAYIQLRSFGLGESAVNELLLPCVSQQPKVEIAFCVHEGMVDVRLGGSLSQKKLQKVADECRELLGSHFVCFGQDSLGQIVSNLLREREQTISVAESCTGGLLSSAFTKVPGASQVFAGGVVTYMNDAKMQILEVPEMILQQHGAVSPEVAAAMATGAAECFETNYALSVTGFAGPGGGSPEMPVGSVIVGLFTPQGMWTQQMIVPGERPYVRCRSVNAALDMVRRKILGYKLSNAEHHYEMRAKDSPDGIRIGS